MHNLWVCNANGHVMPLSTGAFYRTNVTRKTCTQNPLFLLFYSVYKVFFENANNPKKSEHLSGYFPVSCSIIRPYSEIITVLFQFRKIFTISGTYL